MTQCELIQRHLEDYGSITSLEAMQEYGIMRLASRISDLKKLGFPIRKEMVSGKNRYGEPTSYAQYSIVAAGDADG
nr:MAG TPA: helix-turn-helix domain protein [Caudoviricetes sp.]